METLKLTESNRTKLVRVEAAMLAVLDEVLKRGFHGVAKVELTIANGTIQRIARSVECIER